jgi:dipeptidyl aminopeptidase/acylaminoacyl peptidase
MRSALALSLSLSLLALVGCGDRAPIWDAQVASRPQAVGLDQGVALIDDDAHRALMLIGDAEQTLQRRSIPIGHGVLRADAAPDRKRLFVVSSGDQPRRSERDERPSLTVVDGTPAQLRARAYALPSPLSGLSIDPFGRWAALAAGASGKKAFVENPNELVLLDLDEEPGATNPVTRSLRSFGGRPQRLTFTPSLALPGGQRRLLIVETEQDVSIVDLDHARDAEPRPEITVRLTGGSTTSVVTPAGVVVDDGDPGRKDDARVGIRLANDTNVVTVTMADVPAGSAPPNDFVAKVNLTDIGGIASDIAFVRTDGGLRLAALVPSRQSAVLVDPETSITTEIALPYAFSKLSLVTSVVGAEAGSDVALLWGASASGSGIAFWSLGKTAGQPYRSVEVLAVGGAVSAVTGVPDPHPELKVLQTSAGAGFYVLDLASRTLAPLTTSSSVSLSVSPDGERVWAFQQADVELASIELRNVHPTSLLTDLPLSGVFDVARIDGGRALVALHAGGSAGVTVFDARKPDNATARLYSALFLEGL